MKRTLLLTVFSAIILFANHAKAQIPSVSKVTKALPKVDFGIKLGADFAKLGGLQNPYQPGFVGGAFIGLRKNKWGIRAEGLVSTATYIVSYTYPSSQNITFRNTYLDIPVLFEYKMVSRLWMQVGPQFSAVLSSTVAVPPPSDYAFKSYLSGVLGLEARLPAHFVVGGHYIYGVNTYNGPSSSAGTSITGARIFQLYAGFRFL